MPRASSDDLRSRVLCASRDGMSARFGLKASTAMVWIASAHAKVR